MLDHFSFPERFLGGAASVLLRVIAAGCEISHSAASVWKQCRQLVTFQRGTRYLKSIFSILTFYISVCSCCHLRAMTDVWKNTFFPFWPDGTFPKILFPCAKESVESVGQTWVDEPSVSHVHAGQSDLLWRVWPCSCSLKLPTDANRRLVTAPWPALGVTHY